MNQKARFIRRFRLERLERRDLLCSAAAAQVAAAVSHAAAAQVAPIAQAHTVKAATQSSLSASDESNETHLFATLINSTGVVVGTAFYETEVQGTTTRQELLVNVAGGAANASYVVTSGTTTLGMLTTDANGNGRLYLTSSASSSTASASAASTTKGTLPAGFTLAAGATIALASTDATIEGLNGTFATASGDLEPGGHGDCGGDHGAVTRFVAALNSGDTAAGKAVFTTITEADGTATQLLRIHVTAADPSTTLEVSIDGASVGSIATDADGNGHLILSSNPHNSNVGQLPSGLTVTANSTITVGRTINGSFSQGSSAGDHHGRHSHGHPSDGVAAAANLRGASFRRR